MLFKKAFAFPIISGYYIIKLSICLLYSEKKYGIQNKYENSDLIFQTDLNLGEKSVHTN